MLKGNEDRRQQIISWILLAAAFAGLVIFLNVKVDYLLNSDMSSEMLLGKLLASENGILTENWYYSTELRVLNTQLLFALFFHFTNNWHLVRILASICVYLIYIVTYYALCRTLDCRKSFAITAVLLLLPFSVNYADIVLIGLYYIPHIAISFASLALAECGIRAKGKKSAAYLIGLFVLALISGLGGPRQLVILYIPFLLAVIVIVLLRHRSLPANNKETTAAVCSDTDSKKSLIAALGAFCFSCVGYVINAKILSNIYHFQTWNDIGFTGLDFEKLADILNGFLTFFGYSEGKLMSWNLFSNVICLTWIIITFLAFRFIIRHRNELPAYAFRMVVFAISAAVVFVLLYLFTDMMYADRYNLPILILCIPCIALYVKNLKKIPAAELFAVLVIAGSCINYDGDYMSQDWTEEFRNIAKAVQEQGYSEGYATFWNANVLTELTNGYLDIRSWATDSDGKVLNNISDVNTTDKWLQLAIHDVCHPEGKVFLLFTNDELINNNWIHEADAEHCIYSSDDYTVIGFDSYEEMLSAISAYSFTFDNDFWVRNAADIQGRREIYPDGMSYGPYRTLYAGNYIVTITGENLDKADYAFTCDFGEHSADISYLETSAEYVQYSVTTDKDLYNVETVVCNESRDTVILNSITIERID